MPRRRETPADRLRHHLPPILANLHRTSISSVGDTINATIITITAVSGPVLELLVGMASKPLEDRSRYLLLIPAMIFTGELFD